MQRRRPTSRAPKGRHGTLSTEVLRSLHTRPRRAVDVPAAYQLMTARCKARPSGLRLYEPAVTHSDTVICLTTCHGAELEILHNMTFNKPLNPPTCAAFYSFERVRESVGPPAVRSLMELEHRKKNESAALYERKPIVPNFKVSGQPMTSEVWSNTRGGPLETTIFVIL